MICRLNHFILDFDGNFHNSFEVQDKNYSFWFKFQIDMNGYLVLTIPTVGFFFLCLD